MAAPAYAAPNACDAVQSRIRILKETLRKTTNKGAVARLQNEINKLSKDQARLCKKQTPAKPEQQKPAQATGSQQRKAGQATRTQQQKTVRTAKSQQQKSPRLAVESGSGRAAVSPAPSSRKKNVQEKRAVQRPQTIVQQPQAVGGQGGQRGFRHPVGAKTIPVTGHILFAGGSTSTFYGKVRQELTFTILETFVGNLIVSGPPSHEEYTLRTQSTEINVEKFGGRVCSKYSGSPPKCIQWQKIDLWQIPDSEIPPGRAAGVVSMASDARGVALRVDVPAVEFGSSANIESYRSGCSQTYRETISRQEFTKWFRRSKVELKRKVGKSLPNCSPDSTLTLVMEFNRK
ncbi:MAG: hypothetical protein GXY53_09530 [Desulfobulbus sp.]|nr:hypothetical protein [Desulfobulbus sp.]